MDGAPECWLEWSGLWKKLLGKAAHAQWHFTDASRKQPSELTMFIIQSPDADWVEVLMYRLELSPLRPLIRLLALAYDFDAWTELLSDKTPRELALMMPRMLLALARCVLRRPAPVEEAEEEEEEGSEASEGTLARRDRAKKRLVASAGLLGVFLTWAIMSWCAPRLRTLCAATR